MPALEAERQLRTEKRARSIYERALGSDFDNLHPRMQERFGFDSRAGVGQVGSGVMEQVWRGPTYTVPFLCLGAWRNIMSPETGRNIPFRVENYAYQDKYGRETVTWVRKFEYPNRSRRFDATMIYSESRSRIVDYLGTHQHLAVDLDMSRERARWYADSFWRADLSERRVGLRFPLALSGIACVEEWFDDAANCYRIEVDVRNALLGKLFGYRGRFQVESVEVRGRTVPQHVKPVHEEHRE